MLPPFVGWAEFVDIKIRLWEEFYKDWLERCPEKDVFVTHYEILKHDLQSELSQILDFLRLPKDQSRLACVNTYSAGLFKRKPSKNIPANILYYPRELKDKIYRAIVRLDAILSRQGRRKLPVHLYEMFDEEESNIAVRGQGDPTAMGPGGRGGPKRPVGLGGPKETKCEVFFFLTPT